jgi:hypothetical protein
MAVFGIHTWRPMPGRAADLLASMGRAGELFAAQGALPAVWQPIAGGEAGSLTFVVTYSDHASHGRTLQAITASPQWQAFWADAMADPSGTNIENALMSDLDPGEPLPDTPSRVLVTATFRTRPGRLADHLAAQAGARDHLIRLGGQVRTVQTIGRMPGTVTTLIGFEDFEHYGEFGDKLAVDEQWASFWAGVLADPAAEQVESSIYALVEPPA